MQKIKIKSTILVAILIAIFSTIMCMGFVSAEEAPTSIETSNDVIVGTVAHTINYYDKSGELIKTEKLLSGNNMTGIEGYEGNYVVRTENYDEVSQWMSITIPSEDYIKENFVYSSDARAYNYYNNSIEFTNNPDINTLILQQGMYYDSDMNVNFVIQLWLNHLFDLPDSVKVNSKISINGSISKIYTNSYPSTTYSINFCDRINMPALFKYIPNVNRTFEFTSIFDDQSTHSPDGDTIKYVYYYMNETMSLDELTSLNMDDVISNTINVYTDYELPQEPEDPKEEPTEDPSGDENGDIISPSDKPSDEEPIVKEQSKLEKSNAELKAQWTALLAHDWQNAQGWQLITLMIVTLAVVIAIIVTIPVVCHQIKKASNVKRIKARSVSRKR